MKQGIEKAVSDISEKLTKMSIKIKEKSEMANVASIAANNDREIGKLLADAMEKVGKDGVITVDEGKSLQTESEWVEGMQFDRGYLSPYFVTDPTAMEAVLEDCRSEERRVGKECRARWGRGDGEEEGWRNV